MQQNLKTAWDLYREGTDYQFENKEFLLGPWSSYSLVNDPKHLAFVLARYKFCAKMLQGKDLAIEIGCGDGLGIPLIAQSVKKLICLDWDERNIEGCKRRLSHLKNVSYEVIDLNKDTKKFNADAAFSIDVIEHLETNLENDFLSNLCNMLKDDSILITGTPNVTANQYATERSRVQHINLKSMDELKKMTEDLFKFVFMFGMNDEVLHTGYSPMCHYIWSIGAGKK